MGCYLQDYRTRIGAWAARTSSCTAPEPSPSLRDDVAAIGATTLCATTLAVLLIIGEIEANPGPVAAGVNSFINIFCSGCNKTLKSGSQCDSCGLWFHASCGRVRDSQGGKWMCLKYRENRVRDLEVKLEEALGKVKDLQDENAELRSKLCFLEGARKETKEAALNKKQILVLGDSIVRHVGKDYSNMDVVCLPGIRTEQLRRYVEGNDLGKPETICVHVGTNDMKAQNLDFVMGDMYDLVSTLKRKLPSARIYVSGVLRRRGTPWRRVDAINRMFEWVAESSSVFFVDPNSWLQNEDFGRDGLHVNRRGASKLGGLFSRIGSPKASTSCP